MTDVQFATLVNVLAAQTDALLQVRDLLQVALADAPEEPPPDGCQHPEDRRVDLSSLNDRNHWACSVCRFDNKAAP